MTENDYDVVVIGGGPAGIISAVTVKKNNPDKNVLLVKSVAHGVIPCAIPYMFATLSTPEENRVGDAPLEKNGVVVKVAKVTGLDRAAKTVTTSTDEVFSYEKLVLATGSEPIIPPITGVEKTGVYPIKKELEYLTRVKEAIVAARDVVIIGGGFIGLEVADELTRFEGKNVTVVEAEASVLTHAFDEEFAQKAREALAARGVTVITGESVQEVKGGDHVESVLLSHGQEIPCQVIILGVGAKPETKLAQAGNVPLGVHGGIVVDEYMRTQGDENVFAVGDCAEKKDFFTRKQSPVMLASTATAEARVAGSNAFSLRVLRENKGTIAAYSTKIGDLSLAAAGLTEEGARREGFEVVVGHALTSDRHPGCLPEHHTIELKLLFSRESRLLLGGQIVGGDSVGELVNVIALAIQKETTLTELETLQVATHPKLTAAPTTYPIVVAAQNALAAYNG